MRIGLVAVEGCFGAGLVSMLDMLRTADALRAEVDPSIPPISVEIVGARRRVTTGSGVVLPASAGLADLPGFDLLVIGALGTLSTADTLAALGARDVRSLMLAVERERHGEAALAAACTGCFALAEAGILDGGRATTSWWLGPGFRARYPGVDLDLDAMVVTDERAVTAGAAFAHIDLALTLLRRSSAELAELVSRLLVVDDRPSQSAYLAIDHLEHDDALVRDFEAYARANLASPIEIPVAAHAIGASRRTLERRVARTLGVSPIVLVQRLRVERAEHLLRTTGESVDQIAPRVGYANGSTLRALMRRAR
jgi:transcriptional regulator GlxA family with amidase domain